MATRKVGTLTLEGVTYNITLEEADGAKKVSIEKVAPIIDLRRQKAVKTAASQVGLSDKSVYCRVACRLPEPYNWPKYWCAVFNLWCYIVAGLKVNWRWGDPKCWFSARMPTTQNPLPGDTAYFTNKQHHAIIEKVDGDKVQLINGNGTDGKVTRSVVSKSQVTVFYSIKGLLG